MSREPVALDAASHEPLHPAARETLLAALGPADADPRRLHRAGRTARLLLENARAAVAECLDVRPAEVSFTTSGTDAVHRGLLGLLTSRGERGTGTVIASAVEHSAVLHAATWWRGGLALAPVDRLGRVDPHEVAALVRDAAGPRVLALQAANHEVGTRQPVDVVDLPEDVPLFCDAAVAVGRGPLPRRWDVLAGSAHKWGGPAGVGILVVRAGVRWESPFPEDERTDPRASGFENVAAALAAAAALQAVTAEAEELGRRQRAWIDRIRAAAAAIPEVEVVGDPDHRLPHLVTFSCLYAQGEELVHALDRRGFGVASGSACTASTLEPSHVLAAMGALTHGNVRVSLTRTTTEEDVAAFLAALPEAVAEARA
ncbi:cysteine desulfurase family protein [Nocardioides sp.]|uniref:cysteine desulfurase family protein n=1 Tax=Nocardioides sp. TaxID=35761 RepID=UPI0035173357